MALVYSMHSHNTNMTPNFVFEKFFITIVTLQNFLILFYARSDQD